MSKKKRKHITPGEFINRLRDDIFAHTKSDRVRVEIVLNLNANLYLCNQPAQQLRIQTVLERELGASRQEQRI